MKKCFFIMPIGIPETEILWEKVYAPTVIELGYEAIRIKENDDGRSMDEQIVDYINNVSLIIADLTYARPNCYYEYGYAKGVGRNEEVIICCKEDHNPDSKDYKHDKHKLHFDVRQHYVVWWKIDDLKQFRSDLVDKIKQREKMMQKKIIVGGATPTQEKIRERVEGRELDDILNASREEFKQWKRKI